MIHIPHLTSGRLLSQVEGLQRRAPIERTSLEGWACGNAQGRILVLGSPVPADDAGRQALGAIPQSEMRKRRAVLPALALEAQVALPAGGEAAGHPTTAPGRTAERSVLKGQQFQPVAQNVVWLLAIEQQGRKDIGLHICPVRSRAPRPPPPPASGRPVSQTPESAP